tara:strand:- start:969 stop:1136 length:168 start_codon:yes stop_codon:yes gene_type:complete
MGAGMPLPPLNFSSNPTATGGTVSMGGIRFSDDRGPVLIAAAVAGLALVLFMRGK